MRAAISGEMYATDLALEQAAAGVPFREAYLAAKKRLDRPGAADPAESLAKRVSPGACGNLMLDRIARRLRAEAGLAGLTEITFPGEFGK